MKAWSVMNLSNLYHLQRAGKTERPEELWWVMYNSILVVRFYFFKNTSAAGNGTKFFPEIRSIVNRNRLVVGFDFSAVFVYRSHFLKLFCVTTDERTTRRESHG